MSSAVVVPSKPPSTSTLKHSLLAWPAVNSSQWPLLLMPCSSFLRPLQRTLRKTASPYAFAGLDLIKGTVGDRKSAGVLEPLISKVKSLKFATEAAITILRIDDLIKLDKVEPRGGDECH
ncbi:hypothetical protein QR680_000393 [Steinernema hermaphroditum]|uniref:Uncharacterized protein n=1 Tax=Steinernema hermaphroditum TaxID=289476 RepID=A0AA39GUM2_9BILA|nr:hypothetical protein QR680_000393 [Steinernema hermaphroditum]